MISEAKAFWDAIKGKVKSLIRKETENAMRLQRYDVTTAPNGTVMGVRQPFGNNEIFLPYSQEVASATVGDTVLVAWWGSMSNAKVYYFADGYEGGDGHGVPPGGAAGQALVKASAADYDTEWVLPLSMKLLWTNASPGSSFAGQTISLNLSGYSMIAIASFYAVNNWVETWSFCTVGATGWLYHFVNYRQRRDITTTASSVTFGDGGEAAPQAGSLSTNNSVMIPYKIFGIKGVQ